MKSLSAWTRPSRAFWLRAMALAVLVCFPISTASAQDNWGGGFAVGPDEGGEILPSVANTSSGLELLGRRVDLARLIEDVSGTGIIEVQALQPGDANGLISVSVRGHVAIRMNRSELVRGRVAFRFRAGSSFGPGTLELRSGEGRLGLLGMESFESVGLALAGYYATTPPDGGFLGLSAQGATGEFFQAWTQARGDAVVLSVDSRAVGAFRR